MHSIQKLLQVSALQGWCSLRAGQHGHEVRNSLWQVPCFPEAASQGVMDVLLDEAPILPFVNAQCLPATRGKHHQQPWHTPVRITAKCIMKQRPCLRLSMCLVAGQYAHLGSRLAASNPECFHEWHVSLHLEMQTS